MNDAWRWLVHPTGIHPWRWRFLFLWLFVIFTPTVAYASYWGWAAHHDLCHTRDNALARVQTSEDYLAAVAKYRRDVKDGHFPPRGRPPIPGFTSKDIAVVIAREKAYAAAIHC